MLQKAIPPSHVKDSSNADLFYNFGLGYELQGALSDSAKYFELALEEYQGQSETEMEAVVASKLGTLYSSLGSLLQSARAYGIAAVARGKLKQTAQQVMCMCQQAEALLRASKTSDALDIADDCIILCQRVNQASVTLGTNTA